MILRQPDCIRIALELGLPPIVHRLVRGERLEHPLDVFFGWPEEYFLMSDEEIAACGWEDLAPLWDDGKFGSVSGYHLLYGKFVRWSVEDEIDFNLMPKLNWQQLLLPDFQRLYESEMEDERFRMVAGWFGFAYAEDIISLYGRTDLSYEETKAELRRRVAVQ